MYEQALKLRKIMEQKNLPQSQTKIYGFTVLQAVKVVLAKLTCQLI